MMDSLFWQNKKVFLTGHTGFKGAWLSMWLSSMGAQVVGYALDPPTQPNLFSLGRVDQLLHSITGDVRDRKHLEQSLHIADSEIVIHLAAQPIVRRSYIKPVETYAVNLMGTVHLLEVVRKLNKVRAVLVITTDKVYENLEMEQGYREEDRLGGFEPYSTSKACAEMVTASYRKAFFQEGSGATGVASARAGNVIGGGDFGADRLVPDCIRAILNQKKIQIRNPHSLRPWLYILDVLQGYLTLAQRLYQEPVPFSTAWNFGPDDREIKPVEWLVQRICMQWDGPVAYEIDPGPHPPEARFLKLNSAKARALLGWSPKLSLLQMIDRVVDWTRAYQSGQDLQKYCLLEIQRYQSEP